MRSDEAYSEPNTALRNYLNKAEFDPYQHWPQVADWLVENDYLDEINDVLAAEGQMPVESAEALNDEDPSLFETLPPHVREECAKDVIDLLMQHEPHEAPTWAHMSLRSPKLLARTTWLVHFTDHPFDIAHDGFTIGIDQMDRLGLTTYFKNSGFDKKSGGYNFAFEALSRDAVYAAAKGKYGIHAVMFRNSGVHAYHYGDEEPQVIFWGKDVDPRGIIVLESHEGEWIVRARHNTRRGDTKLFEGEFQACVLWVKHHYDQYRRLLTGF